MDPAFAYLAAVGGHGCQHSNPVWNSVQVAKPETLSIVQAGFLATGVLNVIVGLIIRLSGGKEAVDKVLPPIITGSVACTIGIGLGAYRINNLWNSVTSVGVKHTATILLSYRKWESNFLVCSSYHLVATVFCSQSTCRVKASSECSQFCLVELLGYIVAVLFGLADFASILHIEHFHSTPYYFPEFQ